MPINAEWYNFQQNLINVDNFNSNPTYVEIDPFIDDETGDLNIPIKKPEYQSKKRGQALLIISSTDLEELYKMLKDKLEE